MSGPNSFLKESITAALDSPVPSIFLDSWTFNWASSFFNLACSHLGTLSPCLMWLSSMYLSARYWANSLSLSVSGGPVRDSCVGAVVGLISSACLSRLFAASKSNSASKGFKSLPALIALVKYSNALSVFSDNCS